MEVVGGHRYRLGTMTSNYHISKKGEAARCDAKEGHCPLGGQHYDTKQGATQAAVAQKIHNLLTPSVATAPAIDGEAKLAILDLLDINDDEDVLEDIGHTMDARDEALAFVKDPTKTPKDPKAALLLIEDLADTPYDDDEFEMTPETKKEITAWLSSTRAHFENESAESTPPAPVSTFPKPSPAAVRQFETILDVVSDEEVRRTGHPVQRRNHARAFLKDPSKVSVPAEQMVHFLSEIRYFDSDIEGGVIRMNPAEVRERDAWVDSLKSHLNPRQEIKMPKGSTGPNVGGAWNL